MNEQEITWDKERTEKLNTFLIGLSKSEDVMGNKQKKYEMYVELESIYHEEGQLDNKNFRHFYSHLFPLITSIYEEPTQGSIDILTENLYSLMLGYRQQNIDLITKEVIDVGPSIRKLYDHVNLDVARLGYANQNQLRTLSELTNVKGQVAKTKEEFELISAQVKQANKGIKKAIQAEKNYITILGIFASIVIACTGATAFSTSVLENISKASPCRLGLVVVGLAFVLINVVYILTRFIQEINATEDKKIKYPIYMIVLNIICFIAFVIIMWAWYHNVVGIVRASR